MSVSSVSSATTAVVVRAVNAFKIRWCHDCGGGGPGIVPELYEVRARAFFVFVSLFTPNGTSLTIGKSLYMTVRRIPL
jgi:hypothetical protein